MPTALAEWTTARPDVPGFYWWRDKDGTDPQVVRLSKHPLVEIWYLYTTDLDEEPKSEFEAAGSLWWPVRLDPPPVC